MGNPYTDIPTVTLTTGTHYTDVHTVTTATGNPFTDMPTVATAMGNPCSDFPHQICDCSNTLLIVFGCLFAIALALLILTISLLFINGHGFKVLLKKKSENLAESTWQGLQRDAQLSPCTSLHIENTGITEGSVHIELDMASKDAGLEEPSNKPDDVSMKTGDVVWEFPRSRIYLKDILRKERFRNIVSGEAWFIGGKDGVSNVIVNVAKGDKRDFKREIEVMASLTKMKGIVGFLGCCVNEDPMYLITEYTPNGNLHQVLEKMKDIADLEVEGVDW
ncbi:fibroblast growth factor receptor 2-like [Ptychodera flava]|uniref:fibroblast growth factor receptor 2-like n=1 Tax=Ptychodera flava TaxID=63121 RepID=UPI003969F7B2